MFNRIRQVDSLSDAGDIDDSAPMIGGQQRRDHGVVRRLAGAGPEHQNRVLGPAMLRACSGR